MYTQALNLIDTSNVSLAVGLAVFVLVTFVAKYLLDSYDTDSERDYYLTLVYSLVIGLLFAIVSLVAFKQIKTYDRGDILIAPFPTSQKTS